MHNPYRSVEAEVLDIITGRAKFGLDTVQPEMRFAMIERSPVLNGTIESFDDSAAREVDGVLDVFPIQGPEPGAPYVILAHGIAVVATSSWAAMKGIESQMEGWSRQQRQQRGLLARKQRDVVW